VKAILIPINLKIVFQFQLHMGVNPNPLNLRKMMRLKNDQWITFKIIVGMKNIPIGSLIESFLAKCLAPIGLTFSKLTLK